VIEKIEGTKVKLVGRKEMVVNFATFDFLGLGTRPETKEVSRSALLKYGCGSCGPRGFYGTIDTHLKIESEIAKFMGLPHAISYSDAASSLNSVVAAFAKRGDFIVADEGVNEALKTGISLSRSQVVFFKHNDMQDLARVLEEKAQYDTEKGRRPSDQRRFLIVEGLYRNYGDICHMKELLKLKEKFYYRVILDESFSFGVIGKTGRGVLEYFGIPVDAVEAIIVSMETSLASVGGLCIGSAEVIDHQRLSGAGYCFSAAAPPFMSAAALESLKIMENSPQILSALQENTVYFHNLLRQKPNLTVLSDQFSPLHYVSLAQHSFGCDEDNILNDVATGCLDDGFAITVAKFQLHEKGTRFLALRIVTHAVHTKEQLESAASVLSKHIESAIRIHAIRTFP